MAVFLLIIVLCMVGMWFYIDSSLNRVDALADYSGRPAAGSGTNWLIVGSDSRRGLSSDQEDQLHTGDTDDAGGERTDSMMVLHLPDNDTKPTLVSILRDSYVNVPGHGKNKINAAFSFGGPKLLTRTVEQATGLRIDHYVEIGFAGFAGVVDDIGGVNMCLDHAVKDDLAGVNLPSGCQDLDGANALGYVRSRHAFANGDYARAQHQREFIGALAHKIAGPSVFLNPFRFVPLMFDLPKDLTVDRDTHLQNLLVMGWDVRGISSGSVITTAVPTAGGKEVSGAGDVVVWNQSKAQELFNDLKNDQVVPDNLITNN